MQKVRLVHLKERKKSFKHNGTISHKRKVFESCCYLPPNGFSICFATPLLAIRCVSEKLVWNSPHFFLRIALEHGNTTSEWELGRQRAEKRHWKCKTAIVCGCRLSFGLSKLYCYIIRKSINKSNSTVCCLLVAFLFCLENIDSYDLQEQEALLPLLMIIQDTRTLQHTKKNIKNAVFSHGLLLPSQC